jgi:hypothetical protein
VGVSNACRIMSMIMSMSTRHYGCRLRQQRPAAGMITFHSFQLNSGAVQVAHAHMCSVHKDHRSHRCIRWPSL